MEMSTVEYMEQVLDNGIQYSNSLVFSVCWGCLVERIWLPVWVTRDVQRDGAGGEWEGIGTL